MGLFTGAVVLGLLSESPPPLRPAAGDPTVTAPSEDPAARSPGATGEITVNEACLRVLNQTRDVIDAIQDLGDSAADLDIAGVDQAIRALQPLEGRLRENLAECETDTTLPGDLDPLPSTGSSSSPAD